MQNKEQTQERYCRTSWLLWYAVYRGRCWKSAFRLGGVPVQFLTRISFAEMSEPR